MSWVETFLGISGYLYTQKLSTRSRWMWKQPSEGRQCIIILHSEAQTSEWSFKQTHFWVEGDLCSFRSIEAREGPCFVYMWCTTVSYFPSIDLVTVMCQETKQCNSKREGVQTFLNIFLRPKGWTKCTWVGKKRHTVVKLDQMLLFDISTGTERFPHEILYVLRILLVCAGVCVLCSFSSENLE